MKTRHGFHGFHGFTLISALLLMAFGLSARAQLTNRTVSGIVAVTSAPTGTNQEYIQVQGNLYVWTNVPPMTGQIQSTNSAAASATNLYARLAADFANTLRLSYSNSTTIRVSTYLNGTLAITNSAGWMTLYFVTNVIGGTNTALSGIGGGPGGSATNALIQGPAGIYDGSLVTNIQQSAIVPPISGGSGVTNNQVLPGIPTSTNANFAGAFSGTFSGSLIDASVAETVSAVNGFVSGANGKGFTDVSGYGFTIAGGGSFNGPLAGTATNVSGTLTNNTTGNAATSTLATNAIHATNADYATSAGTANFLNSTNAPFVYVTNVVITTSSDYGNLFSSGANDSILNGDFVPFPNVGGNIAYSNTSSGVLLISNLVTYVLAGTKVAWAMTNDSGLYCRGTGVAVGGQQDPTGLYGTNKLNGVLASAPFPTVNWGTNYTTNTTVVINITGQLNVSGKVITVETNGSDAFGALSPYLYPFRNPSAALSNAVAGDTVILGNGLFYANIVLPIPNQVTLRGRSRLQTMLVPANGGFNNVIMTNNSSMSDINCVGAALINGTNVLIENAYFGSPGNRITPASTGSTLLQFPPAAIIAGANSIAGFRLSRVAITVDGFGINLAPATGTNIIVFNDVDLWSDDSDYSLPPATAQFGIATGSQKVQWNGGAIEVNNPYNGILSAAIIVGSTNGSYVNGSFELNAALRYKNVINATAIIPVLITNCAGGTFTDVTLTGNGSGLTNLNPNQMQTTGGTIVFTNPISAPSFSATGGGTNYLGYTIPTNLSTAAGSAMVVVGPDGGLGTNAMPTSSGAGSVLVTGFDASFYNINIVHNRYIAPMVGNSPAFVSTPSGGIQGQCIIGVGIYTNFYVTWFAPAVLATTNLIWSIYTNAIGSTSPGYTGVSVTNFGPLANGVFATMSNTSAGFTAKTPLECTILLTITNNIDVNSSSWNWHADKIPIAP